MNLLEHIKTNGFKLTKGRDCNYSTMVKDGIYGEYTHEDGRVVYWGLSEFSKPPTLITPRPRILRKYKWLYIWRKYRR